MIALPVAAVQAAQVAVVAVVAPGVSGVIARCEAIGQGRRGPRVLQPYFDIANLMRKETVVPAGVGPLFLAAPVIAMACYLTVPMLIPVLTTYPLPRATTGDILGGGFLLAGASFVVAAAAAETGDPFAQLGASRAKTFAAITEPVLLMVFFSVAAIPSTDLPYALGATVRSGPGQIVRPAHLLATVALFMVILYETARIPVETHSGTLEMGMIEGGRPFEHTGPYLALLHWGSAVKQLVLYVILLNVLLAPWGMRPTTGALSIVWAVISLVLKALLRGLVVVAAVDNALPVCSRRRSTGGEAPLVELVFVADAKEVDLAVHHGEPGRVPTRVALGDPTSGRLRPPIAGHVPGLVRGRRKTAAYPGKVWRQARTADELAGVDDAPTGTGTVR